VFEHFAEYNAVVPFYFLRTDLAEIDHARWHAALAKSTKHHVRYITHFDIASFFFELYREKRIAAADVKYGCAGGNEAEHDYFTLLKFVVDAESSRFPVCVVVKRLGAGKLG